MFGFNNISLDKKGRFSFPAKYREDLSFSSKIILPKDPQYPALKVYLKDDWDKISAKLTALQGLDPVVRNLQWTILGNASVINFIEYSFASGNIADGTFKFFGLV